MTDPSTLFLSTSQLRPSWTINGLTFELNLGPTNGTSNAVSGSNNYATQAFPSIHAGNGSTTGALFASIVGQGPCVSPIRLAMRGGTSCWTQATPSEQVTAGMPVVVGDSVFAITQSAAFLSAGVGASGNNHSLSGNTTATVASGSIPTGNVSAVAGFVPSNAIFEQGLCQLQQLVARGLLNNTTSIGNATAADNAFIADNCYSNSNFLVSSENSDTIKEKLDVCNGSQIMSQSQQNLDRKKRQKQSNMVAAFQPVNDVAGCAVTGNTSIPTSSSTASTFAMYELSSPSTICPAANTVSSEEISRLTNSLTVSVSEQSLLSPTTTIMSPSDQKSCGKLLRPIAVKKDAHGTPCQVAEITTSTFNNKIDYSSPISMLSKHGAPSPPVTFVATVASQQLAQLPTSTTNSSTSTTTSAITATTATTMNNGGIPVGIAVARQRYVSNSNSNTKQNQQNKETIATSSSVTSYSSVVPYNQTLLEPSVFTSSISNIGVIAGAPTCEDRNGTHIGGGLPPPIIAWPTHTTGLPSQQQHAAQQWHPYTGPIETQIQTNIPSSYNNYQLARDPVTGQIMLIPANQFDTLQHRTAFLIPGGVQPPTTGYSSTNQQIHSPLIPPQQQQPLSHSLLVSVIPSNINTKQNPVSSTILKLEDGSITGVMMPCDLTKSSSINHTNATAAIGQQLNSSFSLVQQQLTSSNIHNSNLNMPHHFSSISSSGSLLIQQISGNTGPPPLINHSLLVSAESAGAHSVINSQPYLINTQHISSENSAVFDQIQPPCLISTSSQHSNNFSQFSSVGDGIHSAKSTSVTQINSSVMQPFKKLETQTKTSNANEELPVCSIQSLITENYDEKIIEEGMVNEVTNYSVQDASNQTDSMMAYHEELDDDDNNNNNDDVDDVDDDDVDQQGMRIVEDEDEDNSEASQRGGECIQQENKICGGDDKVYSDVNPDFSGLQLLLNGIERVEHCCTTGGQFDDKICNKRKDMKNSIKDGKCELTENETMESDKEVDKPVHNGLEILCALADQRFLEENCRSSDKSLSDQYMKKKNHYSSKSEVGHKYHSVKAEQETRRILSTKYNHQRIRSESPCEGEELQIRITLAKLQKKYRETRKELSRLNHKKHVSSSVTRSPTPNIDSQIITNVDSDAGKSSVSVKRRPGRPRKNSDNLESRLIHDSPSVCDTNLTTPPKSVKRPKLKFYATREEIDVPQVATNNGDLSPPVLEPMCVSPKRKTSKTDILSPPTLIPSKKSCLNTKKVSSIRLYDVEYNNKPLSELNSDDSSNDDTPLEGKTSRKCDDSFISHQNKPESEIIEAAPPVQKRKVGRPRKYPKEDDILQSTETISIKKPKLNLKLSSTLGTTITNKNKEKRSFLYFKRNDEKPISKQVPVTSSVVSTLAMLKSQRKLPDLHQNSETEYKPKITPKLKAEAKLKTWRQDSPEDGKDDDIDTDFVLKRKVDSVESYLVRKEKKDLTDKRENRHYYPKTKEFACNPLRIPPSASVEFTNEDFRITHELLDSVDNRPLRVLIAVGGLFRAGELSAIRAPDLYGIKLDGERGHRTHIYTKEEILKDVVLEVKGKYPLTNGTRVCAFWSSQYLSLYPGFVTSFSSSDESEDDSFTAVEFDDGDSGRIRIGDIRLLPKDFSVNHRLKVANQFEHPIKRRRRISSMSYEEIPLDKQLHSPESPTLYRQFATDKDRNDNSPLTTTTSASYDSSSRSSFNNEFPASAVTKSIDHSTSDSKVSDIDFIHREKNGERKRLKKKKKDKIKDNLKSSCKRKSHKHKTDAEKSYMKMHKRHKHKHKHHKHHKRRKSPSSRKYVTTEIERREYEEKTDHNSNVKSIGATSEVIFNGDKTLAEEESKSKHVRSYLDHSSNVKRSTTFSNIRKDTADQSAPHNSGDVVVAAKKVNTETSTTEIRESEIVTNETENTEAFDLANITENESKFDVEEGRRHSSVVDENKIKSAEKTEKSTSVDENDRIDDGGKTNGKVEEKKKRKNGANKCEIKSEAKNKEVKKKKSKERNNDSITPTEVSRVEDDGQLSSAVASVATKRNENDETEKVTVEVKEEFNNESNAADSCETSSPSNDKFWDWGSKGFKRNGKGRARKEFYKSIKRRGVVINVGDCAVFLTAGSPTKPFIGRIESMWESYGNMSVRVNWFYHPEETTGLTRELPFLGALFESPHNDKNDVQTISHKCDVVPIKAYRERLEKEPDRLHNVYQSNDLYYLAGYYDPTAKRLSFEDGVF